VEQWKPVVGFEDYYEVSDLGRVKGLPRETMRVDGIWHRRRERILKPHRFSRHSQHLRLSLQVECVKTARLAHHLVLEAFVGLCPAGQEARHLNDIASDNRLVNLVWGTRQENMDDKVRLGTKLLGSRTGLAKLRETDIPMIRAARASGEMVGDIARRYSVTSPSISAILSGKTWSHV